MTKKEYNGWTNYETWSVMLLINNEQSSQNYWQEQAQMVFEHAKPSEVWTKSQDACYALADCLKAEHEEGADNIMADAKAEHSVYAQLLGAALSEVNWNEVANAILESAILADAVTSDAYERV